MMTTSATMAQCQGLMAPMMKPPKDQVTPMLPDIHGTGSVETG